MYSALHDHTKWESISNITIDDAKYDGYAHKNFAECLLNSVVSISDSVVTIRDGQLHVDNPPGWQVVYLSFLYFRIH